MTKRFRARGSARTGSQRHQGATLLVSGGRSRRSAGETRWGGAQSVDVSGPYAVVLRMAFALAILPGLGTGLLLASIAGLRLPIALGWPQLAQAHGQIQSIGFVALFIVAVGLQLFPRFLSRPLTHADRATWGSGLVVLALVARIIGQPLDPGSTRLALLLFATAALPFGLVVASSAFGVLHAPASNASALPAGQLATGF